MNGREVPPSGGTSVSCFCCITFLSFRLFCFMLCLPLLELSLAFLTLVKCQYIGEDAPGDGFNGVLRNTGIVHWFLFAAQAARYLRFDIQFSRCKWADAVCGWQISFHEETENAAAVKLSLALRLHLVFKFEIIIAGGNGTVN